MRKVLGVDMEAAALAQSGAQPRATLVGDEGVMDHADQDKDDLLKSFAARASAECLFRFLRASPLGNSQVSKQGLSRAVDCGLAVCVQRPHHTHRPR